MTILSSLKKLHKKMTGQDTTSKTIGGILDSMQENYSGGADSREDTYETVAEIAVGTMEQPQEMPGFYVYNASDVIAPALNDSETYYMNDGETASTLVDVGVETVTLRFNASTGEGLPTRENPNEPLYVIQWNIDNGTLLVISDANEIENTTIKILKKISNGNQTSNSAFIVEEDDQYNITTELEDIYNAALAGKQVYLKYDTRYKTLINFHQGLIGEYYFTFISLDERSINVDRLNNSKKVQESIFILENNEEPS